VSAHPRIAVVGAGAIGGAMAAALGDAGHTLDLCVRTPFERLARTLDGETLRYPHRVLGDPQAAAPADWVLLCTKAHQIDGAAPWLARLVGPHTRVAVMQNGVRHAERVAAWVPAGRAVPCIILLPSRVESPGAVVQGRAGTLQLPQSDAGRALAALFEGQGAVRVELVEDFVTAEWRKLVLNTVGGAICALALKPLRAVTQPVVRDLALGLIAEVMAVGRAEGARFADDFPQQSLDYLRGPVGEHWTSMAQDRRDGRHMEWQVRNAVIGQIARRHGIATPLNDALTALLALADEAD